MIAVAVIVAIWLWLMAPAAGWVNNSATLTTASATNYGTAILDGLYLDLQYPASLTLKRHEKQPAKGLENIFLHQDSDDPATNYSVAVTVLPAGGPLDEVSAVRLRREDPAIYKETAYNDHAGLLFVKNSNGYERTLIWQEHSHTYSLSLTVPIHSPSTEALFTQLVKSTQTQP